MDLLQIVNAQMKTVSLPLYAVTLTAIPRTDTPLLLMLHWHGFRKETVSTLPFIKPVYKPVPGSALQLNDRWYKTEALDEAMLDAAWQLGAWDVQREEHRACAQFGASEQEALECLQAFGEYPDNDENDLLLSEAPDREEMLRLGARVGYVKWQFRPVVGGVWQELADDDTLEDDGHREPPCPIIPKALKGGHHSHTAYRLGKASRIIIVT